MTDFNEIIDRRGTDAIKWAVGQDELPMWIADMDFKTSPAIIAAMQQKVAFGVFGYEEAPDAYYQAIIDWYRREHGATAKREWLLYVNGVVPAISSLVRRVSHVGDNVVVQAPVYNIFYHSIENNGRHTLASDLVYEPATGHYHVDWADLEAKLAEPLSTLMILCNPHNPVGKTWSRTDLVKLVALCTKHHVVLVSDEIHGDLVFGEPAYTPIFALPAETLTNVIALVSPSKAFNVAALHAATAIVPAAPLRESVSRGFNNDELAEPNLLAVPGSIAAYTQSRDWLYDLKQQLTINRQTVADFLATELPAVKLASENATYLLWLDISAVAADGAEFASFLRQTTGLYLNGGDEYRGNGAHFIRMNVACPPAMLKDGLDRLKRGVAAYQAR